jgi:hypothetical protein
MKNESVMQGSKRFRCSKAPECRASDLTLGVKENWIEVSKPTSVIEKDLPTSSKMKVKCIKHDSNV